jgi:hypothetical protein
MPDEQHSIKIELAMTVLCFSLTFWSELHWNVNTRQENEAHTFLLSLPARAVFCL